MYNFDFSLDVARQRKELVNKLAIQTLEEKGIEYILEDVPELGESVVFCPPEFSKDDGEYVVVIDFYRSQTDGYLMELVWFETMDRDMLPCELSFTVAEGPALEFDRWVKAHPHSEFAFSE